MKKIFKILWESRLAWTSVGFLLGILVSSIIFKWIIQKRINQALPMINDFSEEKISKMMKDFENLRIPKNKKT